MSKINQLLNDIQKNLQAPKNQRNNFGNYSYRSAEDILEAVKPLLGTELTLVVVDEIQLIGERYYVKATATISSSDDSISATAYAREPEKRTGMDEAQVTGATSSYARKYALNGLFAIDDAKDADTNEHKMQTTPKTTKPASKTDLASTAQIGMIHSLIKSKGLDSDYLDDVKKRFSVTSSTELTKSQASEVIKEMTSLKDV